MANRRETLFDLIRHGEPEGGPRYRGHVDDPLSELGWQQMRAAIQEQEPWDAILTSPLSRCQAFAEAVADERGLPLYVEPDFKELSFGDWEGRTGAEIQDEDGERLRRFWQNPLQYPPPNGESLRAFNERIQRGWEHWREELAEQHVLLVCHGGVIRMITGAAMGIPLTHSLGVMMVPYACRTRIRLDRAGDEWMSALVSHGVPGSAP